MYNRILGDLPTVGQLGDDQPFQFLPPIVGCSVGFNNTRCRYNPREIHVTQLLPIFPIIVIASRRGIAAEDNSLNPNLGFSFSLGAGEVDMFKQTGPLCVTPVPGNKLLQHLLRRK